MLRGRKTDYDKLPPILQRFDMELKGTKSSVTRDSYIYCLLMLYKYLLEMGKNLEHIRLEEFKTYINYLTQRREKGEISQQSVKSIAKIFKTFAQWLVTEEMLDEHEYFKIEMYVKKIPGGGLGNDDVEALSKEDEIKAYRKLQDTQLSFLLTCGINYGLRRLEYANLRIKHIELNHVEDNKPRPRVKVEDSKGHVKKTRYYYLHPGQANAWRKWLGYLKSLNLPHDHVFFRPKDPFRPPDKDAITYLFQQISKITGIHIPSHRLRYTYATRLWEETKDILLVSYQLGHVRIETTRRYLKITSRAFRDKYLDSTKHLFY